MKTFHPLLAAGLAALLLTACSTAVSPEKSARVDPAKIGLVLATLSRSGEKNAWVEFKLHQVDGSEGSSRSLTINSSRELTLIEVPVGRYEIAGWTVMDGVKLTGPGTQDAAKKFEFEVRAGEVTYLGHFEVMIRLMADTLNPSRVFYRSLPILEDHSAKTIEAFHQQYPALAAVPVRSVAPQSVVLARPLTEPYPSYTPAYAETRRFDPMPTGPKWP